LRQFTTEGYDLGFGIYKRTKDKKQHAGKMVAIMHTQRIDSHLVPEDGSVAVKEPGICKFCLSNQVFYYFKGCRDMHTLYLYDVVPYTVKLALKDTSI
jgi:hypothetical protein